MFVKKDQNSCTPSNNTQRETLFIHICLYRVKWVDYASPSLLYPLKLWNKTYWKLKHLFKVSVNIEKFSNKRAFFWLPLSSPAQAQPGLSELTRLLEKEKYFRPKVEYFSMIVAHQMRIILQFPKPWLFFGKLWNVVDDKAMSAFEKRKGIYEPHLWSLLCDAQMHSPS